MIIDEFKLALFSILGGFIGAVLSLFISGGTGWASAFFCNYIFYINYDRAFFIVTIFKKRKNRARRDDETFKKYVERISKLVLF